MSVKRVTLFSLLLHIIIETKLRSIFQQLCFLAFSVLWSLCALIMKTAGNSSLLTEKEQTKPKTNKNEKEMVRERQKGLCDCVKKCKY